jgi:hypothetical protein
VRPFYEAEDFAESESEAEQVPVPAEVPRRDDLPRRGALAALRRLAAVTALILVSQNACDLLNEQVTNCLSGVFAFRSTERTELANIMSLGVAPTDDHKAGLRALGNGECIFRDLDDRAGWIGIDLVSDELKDWIDTNPTRVHRSQPGPSPTRSVRRLSAGASS